jgi:hypothetical protein
MKGLRDARHRREVRSELANASEYEQQVVESGDKAANPAGNNGAGEVLSRVGVAER